MPATAGQGEADATILTLTSATTIRPHLYFLAFGCSGTPADQAFTVELCRLTADGTGTANGIMALDPSDPTTLAASKENHTVAPTYASTSIALSIDLNQRASFSWIEDPERGIVLPATAGYGVGLYFALSTGGTPKCHATFHHAE